MPQSAVFDLQKWTSALKDIYVKVRLGLKKTAAIDIITKEWPEMEKYNFSNWMKYYESGEMDRYKIAADSSWPKAYENAENQYFLPNPPNPVPSPISSMNGGVDVNALRDEAVNIVNRSKPGLSKEDEIASNNEVRRLLISRLNSMEKHLLSDKGYLFAGKSYKDLVESIHRLKSQILTTGRVSLSAQTCIDLLIKESNILRHKNCSVGSDVMIKLAQQIPGNIGQPPGSGSPVEGGGTGELTTPEMPSLTPPPQEAVVEEDAMTKFLRNLDKGKDVKKVDDGEVDVLDNDDEEFNGDEVIMCEDGVEVDAFSGLDGELVVIGQDANIPRRREMPEEELPLKNEVRPEVKRINPKKKDFSEVATHSDFDTLVNSAFDKLTMEDLLAKLQDINLIFKKKEINKQLALADLMLSRLGLTPYFSNFSEVQQKNLDCLNYSATRMDDIISTLQAGVGRGKIDLTKENDETDPEAQLLQRHLESEEKKDKERKELRKEVNQQKLQEEKPELEVESPEIELAGAPNVPETPAAQAKRPRPVLPGV